MAKILIFGGTSEGRELCAFGASNNIPLIYSTASKDGADLVEGLEGIKRVVGKLDKEEMALFMKKEKVTLVLDATHPYAIQAHINIALACLENGIKRVRVKREDKNIIDNSFYSFTSMDSLIAWLEEEKGSIFSTLGASSALPLSRLKDFQDRVWMRVLPNMESLKTCVDLGYRANRIICMQGPFSKELNLAMLKETSSKILLTKESGKVGGFPEKIQAAKELGIKVGVLSRPQDRNEMNRELSRELSLEEAFKLLGEFKI